jgi:DNA-binding GntR family transcriptional regulator
MKIAPRGAEPKNRSSACCEKIRNMIIRGRLTPGLRLVEEELASRLDVSRTPIREALRDLHNQGLLVEKEARQRTALYVAPLTALEVIEIYELMGLLEGQAIGALARLSVDEVQRIAEALIDAQDRFEDAVNRGATDFDLLFDSHGKFHEAFVDPLAGPRLRELIGQLRPIADRYEWYYAPLVGPGLEATFDEHRAIIEAVSRRDPPAAKAAVMSNWLLGGRRLADVIGRAGERGMLFTEEQAFARV